MNDDLPALIHGDESQGDLAFVAGFSSSVTFSPELPLALYLSLFTMHQAKSFWVAVDLGRLCSSGVASDCVRGPARRRAAVMQF